MRDMLRGTLFVGVCAALAVAGGCRHVGNQPEPLASEEEETGPVPIQNVRQSSDELWIIGRPPESAGGENTESPPRFNSRRSTSRSGPLVRRDDLPRGGELRAKLSENRTAPFPLRKIDVRARVSVQVASVEVRQEYVNPYSEKIRLYQEARRQGYAASLLTEERPNVFTQSVANIEPGRAIDVALTYFHLLPWREGAFELVFPLVVGPRYNPAGLRDGVGAIPVGRPGSSGQKTEVPYLAPGEAATQQVSLEVEIEAGTKIAAVECSTHQVNIERPGEDRARVRLAAGQAPDRDFVLRYRPEGSGIRGALAASTGEGGGYFTLVLEPPAVLEDLPPVPRELVLVLDTSGSMSGDPLALEKRVAIGCLERLRPGDTFQVVRFADDWSCFSPASLPASAENVRCAREHVEALEASGGTEMVRGVRGTLGLPHPEGRLRTVVFLTDGYIGNETEVLAAIRERVGSSRIFTVGIGTSVNRYLLEEMARAGRGAAAYAGAGVTELEDFFRTVERPALTGISIDWGELRVAEVLPDPLPDLFWGRPVAVTGRFEGPPRKTEIRVRGNAGGVAREISIPVDPGAGSGNPALASVWARSKIASLSAALVTSRSGQERLAIRETALRYGLLSNFTSFVAVDSLTRTAGDHGTTVQVPVPVPAGVRYETTVGER